MDSPPEYLAGETPEFVAMADLLIHIPRSAGTSSSSDGSSTCNGTPPGAVHQAVTLPAHSQVLGRASSAVAGLLASFSGPPSGAACSPGQPLDISTFFQGASLPATLLFLACTYAPESAEAQLAAALGRHDGSKGGAAAGAAPAAGVDTLAGMLRLAHRLDAPRLLRTALAWIQQQGRAVYAPGPGSWLGLAEELQLDELRAGVLAWAVRELAAGPGPAAALLQTLDFASLPTDVGPMLLDGLASAFWPGSQLPGKSDFAGWAGAGSLCRAAVRREEAAAAEEQARLAAEAAELAEQQFAAELEAQQEQAAEDWEAAFDEAEAGAGVDAGFEEAEEEWEAGFVAAEQLQWGEGEFLAELAAQHDWIAEAAAEAAVAPAEGPVGDAALAAAGPAGAAAAEPQDAGEAGDAALAGPAAVPGAAEIGAAAPEAAEPGAAAPEAAAGAAQDGPLEAHGAGAGEQGVGPADAAEGQRLHGEPAGTGHLP